MSAIATLKVTTGLTVGGEEREQAWLALSQWEFGSLDAEDGFTFNEKLVKKTGWSKEYAARAIEEYRRFVFLWACSNDIRFVPSPDVDEAWHLSILYTKRYARMCRRFVGGFKDHNPSTSDADRISLRQSYGETLGLYVEVFGENPPADIWVHQDIAPNSCHDSGVIPCGINSCSDDSCCS